MKTSLSVVTCTRCQTLAKENPQVVAWLKAQARAVEEWSIDPANDAGSKKEQAG